jgi:hypothetical protein
MSEIAVRPDITTTLDQVDGNRTIRHLADWADEARAAYSLAATLCKTSFAPAHFRGKPEEATAAILTGHEMGMSPMAALRAIYVIQGTPAMYANAMRAVVQSHGHSIWEAEVSPTRVVVRGHRKCEPDKVRESVWTIERAKQAELMSNAHYRKNPQNMLTARATAEVARLVAADALHGVPYAVEELDETPSGAARATGRVTTADILTPAEIPPAAEVVDDAPADTDAAGPYGEDEWPDAARPGDAE